MKLGIAHERIRPGKPRENGRHERMHRTLKSETCAPPASTLRAQQRSFDKFRHEYNDDRPHEALGGGVPGDFYERSKTPLPAPVWGRDFTYPETMEVVRVDRSGRLSWNGSGVFVSTVLRHQYVGLEWMADGTWLVRFGALEIGRLRRERRWTYRRVGVRVQSGALLTDQANGEGQGRP